MKNQKIKRTALLLLLAGMFPVVSCNKEYINPSAASVPSVTSSPDALMNLCAGLQRRFTIGRQSPLYCAPIGGSYGVYALYTLNIGNTTEKELETGKGAITLINSVVTQMWTQCLLTRTEAETVLDNLNVATEAGDKVGLKAYASIFYALSMGTLAQFYEQIPLETENNATFSPRAEALKRAISMLESADADLAATAPSTKFLSKVPPGIDAKNTVKALLARYYNIQSMISGTYDATSGNKAITYATAASRLIKSEFRFSTVTTNPLGEWNFTVNVFGAIDSTLGLRNGLAPVPAASDPRVGFYISQTGPTTYPLKAFALNTTAVYPVYLPGEMDLIIAENYARQNQFVQAKTALDAVRTKTTDIYGIGAAQPAYSGPMTQAALLTDIYKQRRLEMFLSGQELEDSRRFGRPGPNQPNEERNRNFYPYPLIERDNNPSTPDDPAI
ncbi:RagB/SusD family nutrient uptake outer membrane protein [Chitinophaga sp. GCM10012297]|uniref:RagB/SusD family nutrient uptake outer membrane protein n=1 Tax=Chitinophaga chungangae TaxID=2821488 RepID=A0ABS3YHV9_9BACT|nr:RagB/SusD family nutrient uptake outer membrane protein [Chitinophaga chungangae]MBO9154276.1 RagB/SusD family nutrient uptake outer membrane protein [Chitinophaga chungangae]